MLEIILNIVIIVILGVTIAFCIRLERRINSLKNNKNEITTALMNLDKTLGASQQNIDDLRELGSTTLYKLTQQNNSAKELIHDIRFIIDRGNVLADRLEELIYNVKESINKIEKNPQKKTSVKKNKKTNISA
ncbi:DUF6468 domain-containing protein [Lyticum sinuosum]|uniref:DUF6468 domain-containing protein n=1 Tax=Lyticum sinuosum TaxID=1332059 RepID=A0AAE5AHE7_9RICK|nr:DUF6468 domain-containing protein [Lyticum sinuosum]MDZ5760936.1 hypothetical protein [Lyticum sinuosum]